MAPLPGFSSLGYRPRAFIIQASHRDRQRYKIRTPTGAVIHVLLSHFKPQSGKGYGGEKRRRQATQVRKIVNG
jgi:hypothetical protein